MLLWERAARNVICNMYETLHEIDAFFGPINSIYHNEIIEEYMVYVEGFFSKTNKN